MAAVISRRRPDAFRGVGTKGIWASAALALAILFAGSVPVRAVIRVDVRAAAIYDVAKVVLIGKVARIDAATKQVEVDAVEVVKGDFAASPVFLDLAQLGEYLTKVQLGEPVVIFDGVRSTAIHLSDHYLTAKSVPETSASTWRVTQEEGIPVRYPGRTAGLVQVVHEFKVGHSSLMNAMEHLVWRGGVRVLGPVLPGADYVLGVDLNGDGKDEVLFGNQNATQLRLNSSTGLTDQTAAWRLSDARGKQAAAADINGDGKMDLLIGRTLWVNQDGHFENGGTLPFSEASLATALIDVTGDGRPDAVFLTEDGRQYGFENSGKANAPWTALPPRTLWSGGEVAVAAAYSTDWGDDGKAQVMVVRPTSGITRFALDSAGGPAADFQRLCGEPLDLFNRLKNQTQWNVAGAVALQINGDRRMDFIVFHDDGGPTFVNRGFGTFFLSTEPAVGIRYDKHGPRPWVVNSGTRFGAGDIQGDRFDDLLIVTEEGQLFELDNTPYPMLP